MTEQIGKVTLDLSHYPGEDYYCDGTVEDEILEIVKNAPAGDYQKQIEEKKSWPVFYHLSPQRENIVSWLPMDKSTKVLEVGSGMGAVTGVLAEKAGSVTCVDLSKKRSTINAIRNQERDNVTIHVGNFTDIEPDLPCDYDYVLLIGVFEYGQSYIPTKTPFEDFLKINLKHVKPGGNLVIAIENKMGMKYWAGCQEDHLAKFFVGVEDYPEGGGVRTFTRRGLERLLRTCGVSDYHFYYPYPDYKFADVIYSDKRLPRLGELSRNLRNFDGDRLLLFDEKNAFDMVIREGIFPMYSNSYLLMTGPAPETIYSKFSNDRADIYAIRTDITENGAGKRRVLKYPDSPAAVAHVENIARFGKLLKERYEEGGLHVNRCEIIRQPDGLPCASLEYLEGVTLEELLDNCLEEGDQEGFYALFEEYLEKIRVHQEMEVSDYDLVFGNILIDAEGRWNLIDYEWTFEERVDMEALAYRSLYCYQMGDGSRKGLSMEPFLRRLGISEEKAEEYFSALRENIVKTADLIQVARDEIEQELHTSYYAKGDSAELYADIQTQVTATAESVVMNYDYNETILADVNGSLEALEADAALLNQFKVHTEGFIRSGIVAWEDNVPIFGIAIGQNLVHKETQYEGNTYDDLTDNANVAYYTATGITFTVAGQKVATFDQQKMQVEGIEVGTYLLMDENWQWSTAGGSLALKWIGG